MKVAVTGSSGLIGTALAASLCSDGHQVNQFRYPVLSQALSTELSSKEAG